MQYRRNFGDDLIAHKYGKDEKSKKSEELDHCAAPRSNENLCSAFFTSDILSKDSELTRGKSLTGNVNNDANIKERVGAARALSRSVSGVKVTNERSEVR
jgi:hypothetical protein